MRKELQTPSLWQSDTIENDPNPKSLAVSSLLQSTIQEKLEWGTLKA